jgi:threonine dehydrogenase-like Zn-dependent dehydrogenase
MGHEFCGEIIDYGPSTTRKLKAGTTVCWMPPAHAALTEPMAVGVHAVE